MKKTLWILVLLLAGGALFWVFRPPEGKLPNELQTGDEPVSASQNLTGEFRTGEPSNHNQPPTPVGVSPWTSAAGNPKTREEIFKSLIDGKNRPVNFFGKVVDQQGNPIEGAKVKLSLRHWAVSASVPLSQSGTAISTEKETEATGEFEWHDESGDSLTIEQIQKPGYRLSPKTYPSYSPDEGSATTPVIFKMWKMGTNETLVSAQKVFGIIPDGRNYTLDLVQGKKTEGAAGGDVRISITRPSQISRKDKYDWSFVIEGVDGGLLKTDDEFMYLAPESGYARVISMQFKKDDSTWTPMTKMQLFLRSRNGQVYGRAEIEVQSFYNGKSALEINYSVNPSGSRNLQP